MSWMQRQLIVSTASLSVLAAVTDFAHAQSQSAVVLNIPVNVTGLLESVAFVRVSCEVTTNNPGEVLGSAGLTFPIEDGALQETVQIEINPDLGHSFVNATRYSCELILVRAAIAYEVPVAEAATGDVNDWYRARLDKPFNVEISGLLIPGVIQLLQGNQMYQAPQ